MHVSVGLQEREQNMPREMSGGEVRRVAIERVLVNLFMPALN